ncbi:hypothetical protein KI387_017954, partial [Taxus chinensis]
AIKSGIKKTCHHLHNQVVSQKGLPLRNLFSSESSHQSCGKGKKWTWSEQDSGSHHQISSPKLENSRAKPQTQEISTKLEDVPRIIEIKGGMDNLSRVEEQVFLMRQYTTKFQGEIRQWIKIAGVIPATE